VSLNIIGDIIGAVGKIADDLITTDEEKAKLALENRKLDIEEAKVQQAGDLAQIEVNKEEAKSASLFVSGWRPFIGWTCGVACAWNWLGLSLVDTAARIAGHPLTLKAASLEEMMPVMLGLLGLGGLRTFEKVREVARK